MTTLIAGTRQKALNLAVWANWMVLPHRIPGIIKEAMITARKLIGVLPHPVGTRNLLGANQISLGETRNPLGTSRFGDNNSGNNSGGFGRGNRGRGRGRNFGPHGMEVAEMMNPVAKGRILMVAEEEGEVALGEVVRAGTMAPRRWSHPESQEKYPTWRGENAGERDSLSQQAAPVALLICGPATTAPVLLSLLL